jgi:predicted transposase/invertase (TIGR01784 family)
MYALFQKFVDNDYKEKLSEVFEMTVLGNMLIEKGVEKGIEKGEKKKAIEIAKNLLDVLAPKVIAEKTGLTIEEIEELRKEK